MLLAWLVGIAVGGGPFFVRNLIVFGQISGYTPPPSDLSLREIQYATRRAIIRDLAGSEVVADWGSDGRVVVLGLFLLLLALWPTMRRVPFGRLGQIAENHRSHILLISYAVFYVALVVATRAKYWLSDFPGTAAPRHFVQVYWIIWLYAAILALGIIRSRPLIRRHASVLVAVGLLAALVLQVRALMGWLDTPPRVMSIESTIGSEAARMLVNEVRSDQIVLANDAWLLRLYLDLNARVITGNAGCRFLPCFTREDIRRAGEAGLLWGVVIDDPDGTRRGKYGSFMKGLLEQPTQYHELRWVSVEGPAVLFRYVR